jgi:excisionase family DNA binding protein
LTYRCPDVDAHAVLGETGQKMERLKEVMTLREASQYLGISPDTLYKFYKYLSEDKIPAFKLGNRWRFKKDLLDRWMEQKSERTFVPRPKRLVKTTVKG